MLDAAVAFGRILRGAGLRVGTDRLVEFARALEELDAGRRDDVYWAGRITLVSRPEEIETYDRAFELFWDRGASAKTRPSPKSRSSIPQPDRSVMPPKETVEKDERGEEAVRLRYSPVEVLRTKDFSLYSPEEFAELQRLLADLRLSGALRRSRRLEPAHRGRHDPRRTLRGALRTGGEAVRHRFRKARVQPRKVVLLCDVSGSMAPYSRALLRSCTRASSPGRASRRSRWEPASPA
jgi:uncharacterized protein with von Willebrand factor type A (vWA) domain